MNYIIRKGEKKDAPHILQLIRTLAIQHKAEDMIVFTPESFSKAGFEGNEPDFHTFVAQADDDQIIGCVLYFDRFSTWKGPSIHIEDIIADPRYRGMGIGKRLLEAVVATAKERGVDRIELDVEADNDGAISFYKAKGFEVDKWFSAKLYLNK